MLETDLSPDCRFIAVIKDEWGSFETSSEAEILTLQLDESEKKDPVDF
jgi:hypothetical protein